MPLSCQEAIFQKNSILPFQEPKNSIYFNKYVKNKVAIFTTLFKQIEFQKYVNTG